MVGTKAGAPARRVGPGVGLLLVAALLAGCGAADDGPLPADPDTDAPPATSDDGDEPNGDEPNGDGDGEMTDTTLEHELTFEQSGGWIPGGVQQLAVAPDGTAVLTTGSADILEPVTFQLSEAEMTQLSAAVASAAIDSQADAPEGEAEDDTVFQITYGPASVASTQQGADGELRELFDVLEAIVLEAPDHD